MGNKFFIWFFLVTVSCQANAIVPLINIFTTQTMLPALVLTILIIFVEAYILKRWIQNMSFMQHLKHSTLNNIISSAIGSIFVWVYFLKQPFWEIMVMYPIMFVITLLVETPLLKKEYIKFKSWKTAIKKSFILHITSYVFVFLFQPVLFIGWAYYGNYMDKKAIDSWKHMSILEHENGQIYMIKKEYNKNTLGKYVLYMYDVKSHKNQNISLDLKMDDRKTSWDIKDKILAYSGMNNLIYIVNIETGENLFQFKIAKDIENICVSPNKKMIAILEYEYEGKVKKDQVSYYMLGSVCRLNIYDVKSGKLLKTVPRLALNESVVWSQDSESIYFISQKNKDDLKQNKFLDKYRTSYGRGYIKDGKYPREVFKYILKDNNLAALSKGEKLVGVKGTNLLLVEDMSLRELNLNSLNLTTVPETNVNSFLYRLSPSGNNILMLIRHKSLLAHSNFLVIQNIKDQDKKIIVDKDYYGDFRWSE